jgi:putative ABC transport system permease protein
MSTRWIKIFRDLWCNRSRTILVILSIAIGVFAIGMITASQNALLTSLYHQYGAIKPADAILQTEPHMDQDFISSIANMRGIEEAEGRRSLPLRISLDGNGETWRDLTLYALNDFDDQKLMLVNQQDGTWPPKKGEVLMERASMEFIGVNPGDTILVKTTDGRKYSLKVTGRAHDLYRIPPVIEGWIFGYVSTDTIRWMKQPEGFNELYIKTNSQNPNEISDIVEKAAKRIEGIGLPVYQKTMPDQGEHPLSFIINTVILLLGLLAVLAMLLSAFLVINIISALITQQERQIGIMKAIGAKASQIISLYFGMIAILGAIACLIAIPFSYMGANSLVTFIALIINFDPPQVTFSWQTLMIQLAVGLVIPILAATPVILNGTKVSPAMVLSEYGINQVWQGAGIMEKILKLFPKFTRDIFLAMRNPFRKRGRMFLSLISLTFAGAVFMSVINLSTSLNQSLNEMFGFWRYDAWLIVDDYLPAERLVNKVGTIPDVVQAEPWGFAMGRYVREDDSESHDLYLLAPQDGSLLLDPPIIDGRDLLPGETNSILVAPGFLADEPDLKIGSQMTLKVDGVEEEYTIVGVMNMMGNSTVGYFTVINYSSFVHQIHESNRANAIVLNFKAKDMETQQQILSQVETLFDDSSIDVLSTFLITEERQEINAAFGIIMALLL